MTDSKTTTNCSKSDQEFLNRLNLECFDGPKKDLLPFGNGEYKFQNGVIYRGQFVEGVFHGQGTLHTQQGERLESRWASGELVQSKFYFKDNLLSQPSNVWSYCSTQDRRFWTEIQQGIQYDQVQQLTYDPELQNLLPYQCYQFGDDYYNPQNKNLYDIKTHAFVKKCEPKEAEWIVNHCRIGTAPHVKPINNQT